MIQNKQNTLKTNQYKNTQKYTHIFFTLQKNNVKFLIKTSFINF